MAAQAPSRGVRPASPVRHSLADLAARLRIEAPQSSDECWVTGVAQNSAAIVPGDLYVARPGARVHGAQFADRAAAAGAVAALTDAAGRTACRQAGLSTLVVDDPRAALGPVSAWVYGEPARALTMLGVTGTNGKTTTAYLLDAALRRAGALTGLVGTVETRVGDMVLPSTRTTPEAPDLHALLAVMRERGVDTVSMEVSSHALALGRVDAVTFDIVAFTNLTRDHLEIHGDMEAYFRAKASLFTQERARRGVVNVDDTYGARIAAEADLPIISVSPSGRRGADWRVTDVTQRAGGGTAFVATGPEGDSLSCTLSMPGMFNVANALVAIAMLRTAGVDAKAISAGLADVAVPGRMEPIIAGQNFAVVVDYAHTPDAIASTLAAVRPGTRGRIIAVVGCGGDRDADKRAGMGAAAASGADVLVVTDDNPRSEDAARIRAAALAGARIVPAPVRAELVELADRADAIGWALRTARSDDAVVVMGKGHEQGQEVDGVVHPFDDRCQVRRALRELGGDVR